ncbi:MAG TPA: ZIP family metal transporter [Candidatus Binataceae bacterium]|nr:ZIP family metal transporter [Candidatus Binataceae bacterium]
MTIQFIAYLFVVIAAVLIGGLLPLVRDWSDRGLILPVSFSGGVLLGAAFLEMIPDSAPALGPHLGAPLVAGFLMIFVLEHFVLVHPHPEGAAEHGQAHHIHFGLTAYVGIFFHSLLDGLAISATYRNPALGSAVLMAIVFHKVPTAFALTSLLMLDRWKRPTIVFWMSLFALATPLGAIVTWLFLRDAGSLVLAGSVALSAGSFLAIATSDILPQISRSDHNRAATLAALFAGLALGWISRLLAGG